MNTSWPRKRGEKAILLHIIPVNEDDLPVCRSQCLVRIRQTTLDDVPFLSDSQFLTHNDFDSRISANQSCYYSQFGHSGPFSHKPIVIKNCK
jgi:hypothetical protein